MDKITLFWSVALCLLITHAKGIFGANTLTIDDFGTDTFVDPGNGETAGIWYMAEGPASPAPGSPTILGGYHDIAGKWDSHSGAEITVLSISDPPQLLYASAAGFAGEWLAQWDGLDSDALNVMARSFSPGIDPPADFTQGGINALRIRVVGWQNTDCTITFTLCSDPAACSEYTTDVLPTVASNGNVPYDVVVPYFLLSPVGGLDADLTQIKLFEMSGVGTPDQDFGISILEVAPYLTAVQTCTSTPSPAPPGTTLTYQVLITLAESTPNVCYDDLDLVVDLADSVTLTGTPSHSSDLPATSYTFASGILTYVLPELCTRPEPGQNSSVVVTYEVNVLTCVADGDDIIHDSVEGTLPG